MKNILPLLIVLLAPLRADSQSGTDSSPILRFCPGGLVFTPLKAGNQEPRMGLYKFSSSSGMDVEIGNTAEILSLDLPSSGLTLALGIDFFGRAFVTGSEGLRLQVDALDGFFGGDLSCSREVADGMLTGRLRILHQSSHFVDGHLSSGGDGWSDGRPPIPYTRDFGELTLGHFLRSGGWNARYYAGLSYATLVRPSEIERFAYLAGIEVAFGDVIGPVLGKPSHIYFAYHLALDGAPAYAGSNRLQLGAKLGEWTKAGVDLYVAYYNGRHIFGEYIDRRLDTFGAGFMVDFF